MIMPQTEIILQRLTPNDAEDFYALAHSDGEISRFLPSYVQDLISTQEMIKDFAEQYDEKWHYYYMIKAHKKNVFFLCFIILKNNKKWKKKGNCLKSNLLVRKLLFDIIFSEKRKIWQFSNLFEKKSLSKSNDFI